MKKEICLTVLLLIAAFMSASCAKKSETDKGPYPQILAGDLFSSDEVYYREGEAPSSQTKTAASSNPHPQILNGDLSAFAGIWVNAWTRNQLFANGVFVNSSTRSIDGIKTGDFNENNGAYIWGLYDGGRLGYEIGLFPAGVQIYLGQNLVVSDASKDRILIFQFDGFPTNDDVFYREGETAAQLEHEELRIGSSVSGYVSGDAIDHYSIRSSEEGEIILQIESDVEIWLEVYQGGRFILESTTNLGEYLTRAAFSAQPDAVYHLQVRSYVRDAAWEAYRITASFSRLAG